MGAEEQFEVALTYIGNCTITERATKCGLSDLEKLGNFVSCFHLSYNLS